MNKIRDEIKEFVKDVKEILNINDEYEYEVKAREENNDIVTKDINDLYELEIDYNNVLINDDKKLEIDYK